MATKKKSKSNFVQVGGKYGNRYRLENDMMVSIFRNGRVARFGRFIPRGEVGAVLTDLFRNGQDSTQVTSYFKEWTSRNKHTATLSRDGALLVGCHKFSKLDVKKLARWAGINIASR